MNFMSRYNNLIYVLFLIVIITGCTDILEYIENHQSPFNNPLFADYETYQDALQKLDDTGSMSDEELEDLLFGDSYRIHPEFLPHIQHYQQLKMKFTGQSKIKNNVKFVLTDLGNISTEADFIEFKNKRTIKGKAGQCQWMVLNSGKPLRLIEIDYTFWNLKSLSRRESIIFHELGHCDLDREDEPEHISSFMVKKSKMSITFFEDNILREDEKQNLYQELFNPEKVNNLLANSFNSQFRQYEALYLLNSIVSHLEP